MLFELYVRNLATIQELRMEFRPGLNILSGEEGAGKSLIVDALCLLIGGRASTGLVRSGSPSAVVEGAFSMPGDRAALTLALSEAGIEVEADDNLIISREVRDNGRSVARVNGRAVAASLLQEIGPHLVDVSSQMEHLSLLSARCQADLLDGYGELLEMRSDFGARFQTLGVLEKELAGLADMNPERRRELLEFQVAEIEAAGVSPGEDESLERDRQLLHRAHLLKEGCFDAYDSLYAGDSSAGGHIHRAIESLRSIVAIDTPLGSHLEALGSLAAEIEETARELRRYAEGVEARSGELEQLERRLELLRHLKSKYGPGLSDVLAFAGRAKDELAGLYAFEQRRGLLQGEIDRMETEAGILAEELSRARQEAARALAELVNRELADLGMPYARFDIALSREKRDDGLPTPHGRYVCSERGIDRVQFLGATNPGEPLRPLADIASGGETCRFMLAVKGALRQADQVPTLVFDEIDAGLGGRSAQVVGRKLADLARDRQLVCITHLPQIACFGTAHHRVSKEVSSGSAVTRVEILEGDLRRHELAAMLGSSGEHAMLMGAEELLRQAASAGEARSGSCGTIARHASLADDACLAQALDPGRVVAE